VYASAIGGIHHCTTNFRDKYFTDGHYAGSHDINYGCDCGDGCIVHGESK